MARYTEAGVEDLSPEAVEADYADGVRHCRRLIEHKGMDIDDAIGHTITQTSLLPCHFTRLEREVRQFYETGIAPDYPA